MIARLERDAGRGVSTKLEDRAFWLDDIDQHPGWYRALVALDKRGDKSALVALLRGEGELPPSIRRHIADLLERYQLKRRAGKQRTPSYDLTPTEAALALAIAEVRERPAKMSVTEAVMRSAKHNGVNPDTLAAAYSGKLGSWRRRGRR
jgi:hypothetical protein